MHMKCISIIPARSGSKGVTHKNISKLRDCPLLVWSIRASILTAQIDHTFLSTDSPQYAQIAKKYGLEVPFLRPSSISGDLSSDLDFFRHLVDYLDEKRIFVDTIVHLRPTSPFRKPSVISAALQKFDESPTVTSLRSVHKMSESAFKSFQMNAEYNLLSLNGTNDLDAINGRGQVYPETYHANGYVDIIRVASVRAGFLHGHRTLGFVTEFCPEIDTLDDLKYVRYLAESDPSYALNLGIQ